LGTDQRRDDRTPCDGNEDVEQRLARANETERKQVEWPGQKYDFAIHLGQFSEMNQSSHGRRLGLVGGLGVGATIHYYQELVKAHALRDCVPELLIIHADVTRVLAYAGIGLTRQLAEYLSQAYCNVNPMEVRRPQRFPR
jgi:hypothetical protein